MEWSNVEVGFLKECQVLEPKLTYGSYGFVPLHELRYHEKLRQLELDRAEQKVHQSNQAQQQQQQQMDIDCNNFAQQQEFNHHNADSRKRRTCDENGDEENGPLQDISHANKKFRHWVEITHAQHHLQNLQNVQKTQHRAMDTPRCTMNRFY
ncbi:putative cyclin-dependent serine/threonine-protein kinase DDB_G0272797/DDB_G0274007 isoform X2 [Trichogramma pretiosum]|uniref:putative cyclin-dependent serine/threonine-protein kinase DDB_G0272797/DDB_G0274007 isoform X2 n=1 Tax=Trichogramma pretiosum TaxID=7493 RepID=UPI0006C9D221|nr:putative cyclin-dependent serine/threonine-protein kinase DDB_G0272797/DDB_G0274007 isoform X2 [Trichogramma pretiosum]